MIAPVTLKLLLTSTWSSPPLDL
ncbi:MAG: hypothetical protein QOF55_1389, partial [Thermoleophilaceae bacterium]|nr:hypothetical protein [Thermoleophilaceae bacterium]